MDQPISSEAGAAFARLVDLIARLRAPGGCPWDREQTHESLKPMTIEEAYEVLEAIDEGDDQELAGELGDLLLQVVFHANVAHERGAFDVREVIRHISDKMVRRHPHVFGDAAAADSAEVLRNWEALKKEELLAKGGAEKPTSMLDSVSTALPAVLEGYQLTTKASRVGFDWPDAEGVLKKLEEEIRELREALGSGDRTKSYDEVGDVLFSALNVARLIGHDPESALKAANRKFRRRFRHVEQRLAEQGKEPAQSTLEEMDRYWEEAKSR
jgi:tetrapyrrole methylase family protein/MazG family protein